MYEMIQLSKDYSPTEDEDFMSPQQLGYFKQRLVSWRMQLLKQTGETLQQMQEKRQMEADVLDVASNETDQTLELRARDRQRKLINKIDEALRRIESGNYGYCEETGDPIGLRRLMARPIATLSIEAQERHEHRERLHRTDY